MAGEVPEALRACIGRVATYTAPDPIGEAGIRLFALAMQDDNPLYQDAEVAAASRHGGIVAPPTLLCETNQPCRRAPDDSGYFGHAWDLPLPSKDFLRGGNEYEFHEPARPDDRITVTWTLLDIQARETRNGRLFLVISEARYTNQRGELLAVNRETNIHQP
ncbi:MaoC family dehydratase N-terminal domain-containing protein [Roseomonas sp. AR75]|uniref:FAS1-like dehydratase domain-containing protein n=1 Tax=Roseomonas sp. AR75 TaxID=2562311 RepID=UPI00197DDA1C|nr:MaoC family dehydratase N-terminal domain-containing protein [Roseomonas sp. AR75]